MAYKPKIFDQQLICRFIHFYLGVATNLKITFKLVETDIGLILLICITIIIREKVDYNLIYDNYLFVQNCKFQMIRDENLFA